MDIFCKICGSFFPSLKALHFHIARKEKMLTEEYYHKFYPRRDYFSFEQIKFKSYEEYFNTFFTSRKNLVKWFQAHVFTEEAKDLALKLINARIKLKKLKYIPSEVELRSSMTPSILGLEKIFGCSYDNINFGPLIQKFDYSLTLEKKNIKDSTILIDTREQKPLKFNGYKSKIFKLDVGDYSIEEPYYDDLFIERKSIEDFFSTFGTELQFKRFMAEVKRAEEYGFYIIVMVERDIDECLNYYSSFSTNRFMAEYAFHNVKYVMQHSDSCQFVFVKNREILEDLAVTFLANGQLSSKIDLQYLVDKRKI